MDQGQRQMSFWKGPQLMYYSAKPLWLQPANGADVL